MHLIKTFAVKLLQILVSDASPKKTKKVPASIPLIELTKIIDFSRLNKTKNAKMQKGSKFMEFLRLFS